MASSSSAWRTLCASAVLVAVAFVCMEVHRSHRAELLDIKYGLPDNEQDYQLTDKDVNDVVSNTGITFSVTRPRSSKAKKPVTKSTDDQVIMNFKQIETAALADLNRLEAEDRNSKGRTMTLHEEHEYSGLHHLGVNTGEGPMGSYWDSKFDHEEDTHPKGKHVVRSNGKLKEAGVNTGEDEERWMDEAIEPKQKMPAGIFEEPKTLKHHSQPEEEAASVDSVPKLEKMGVNTGERKAQWNDAISETKDVKEGAYQFGVPDGRKEIPEEEEGEEEGEEKPAEEEGETEGEGEEAEGEEAAAAKAVKMPQLHTARAPSKKGSAHQFFEKMVAPAMQHARAASSSSSPAVPSDPAVVKEAAPYMKQVNSVAKEAKAVAAAAAAKEHQALEAVKEDNLAAKMAQAVAQAKVAAAATEASLQAKVESFEHQLARARNIIPGARKANLKSTVPGPATVTPTPPKVAKSQADTEEVAAGHGPATMAGHIETAATKAGHIDTAATKAGHIDTAAKKNKAKAKAHGMAQQAHGETRALELAAAAFPAAPHAHVTAPQPTHALSATKAQRAVAQLEKDVAADRKENKALSSAADIDGFLSSVNTPKGHVSAKKKGHVSAKSKGQSLHSAPVTYSKAAGTAKKVAGPKVVAHDNLKAQAGLKAHKEGMKLKGGIKTQGLAIKASYMCSFTFWGMRPLCPSSGASV